MKEAYLVTFSICTRVTPDSDSEHDIIEAAKEKIISNAGEYVITDNVERIIPDKECPYGTFKGEN